jgi:hypothetical protein
VTFGSGSLSVVTNLGTTSFTNVGYLTGALAPTGFVASFDTATALERITFLACFLAGTRITTQRGAVPVEALGESDLVLTQSGTFRPVRWIGHRRIDTSRHPDPTAVLPIRIVRDAFAPCVPSCDLLLSPDHAVWVDGLLVPIRLLVNGATIIQDKSVSRPLYFHVELDQHDILLADGMLAESYLDTGNRSVFENGGSPVVLHPDLAKTDEQGRREALSCAPLACDPLRVEPMWRSLAERSQLLGFSLPQFGTTEDPALAIVAGGRLFQPVSVENGRHVFVIPELPGDARLVSRNAAPCEVKPWMDDRRRLGVPVSRISIQSDGRYADLAMDDPTFADGWWAPERDRTTIWRWTDGSACLPFTGKRAIVEITVCGTLQYPIAHDHRHQPRRAA